MLFSALNIEENVGSWVFKLSSKNNIDAVSLAFHSKDMLFFPLAHCMMIMIPADS